MFAGAMGAAAPSKAAAAGAEFWGSPGTEEVLAQVLQVTANMAVVGAAELMDTTVRQHGKSPAVALNEIQINTQIQQDLQKDRQNND